MRLMSGVYGVYYYAFLSGGSRGLLQGATCRAREREPITGVWGRSPQRGSRGQSPRWGVRGASPPEAENFFPFAHPAEAANLSYFLFISSILHVQA